MIIPIAVEEMLTKDALLVAIYVLAGIAAIETGIIGDLATRVGSLRNLFRITASIANKRAHNATNKKNITSNNP